MKRLVIGILAHVDAGKTTLSESILYTTGGIRKLGRVDNKDAFLDTNAMERERGITIFSKQAVVSLGTDTSVTLLDTPGHVDFSAEMERTLQVLDYAILVISGADGVQGHTMTLWRLLERYQVPVFLFVNKMDQSGVCKENLMQELKQRLSGNCIDFTQEGTGIFYENIAVSEEQLLEEYLESGQISQAHITEQIQRRMIYPCYFGSALKVEGITELLGGIERTTKQSDYGNAFGARIYKIARDEQGNRLSYMKITGGSITTKMLLSGKKEDTDWEEKVNQIRVYSGEKYEVVQEAFPGDICAVTGLSQTYPGEGLGMEVEGELPILEPVLNYQIVLPDGMNPMQLLPQLRILEEEEPQLQIVWNEELQELQAKLMGEVQIEILRRLILERFGVEVTFGAGRIVYKETIANVVEGVGHFEPLRHYAEVHLLLEPDEPGSGVSFYADCSEDVLSKNWQRLILTHLREQEHKGVLTGSAITDMRITVVAGRAHTKHTEGGDFRQATYRAVRQGLMQADSILLEPYYNFRLELPEYAVGRAMTDIEKMQGSFSPPQIEVGYTVLCGSVPVACMRDYQKELIAYTKGNGRLSCTFKGYEPCHNTEEVMEQIAYDATRDVNNTPDSVFCAHGAGFIVEWYQVKGYMHVPSVLEPQTDAELLESVSNRKNSVVDEWIGTDEIDAIIERTAGANRRDKATPRKGIVRRHSINAYSDTSRRQTADGPVVRTYRPKLKEEEYLLVDGYNVIFAWQELKELAAVNIDGARGKLMDILCNYQGIRGCNLIVVFDAYRVAGHKTEILDYHNIHVVYTKEAETADQYIEHFAHENANKYHVTVATSDGLEQIIIRGAGCSLISSREFEDEVKRANTLMLEQYEEQRDNGKVYLDIPSEAKEK